MKKIILIISLLTLSSCSMLLSDDQSDLITEKTCRSTCLETNKIYIDYDTDTGCSCQER